MSELIAKALQGVTDTKAVVIGEGVIDRVGEVFQELFGNARAKIIGDERTYELAGVRVAQALACAGVDLAEPYIFPGSPELYAEYANCEVLRGQLAGVEVIAVAVGAGTLGDIVKRASGELGRPYIVVGTAASMDGYTAFGSSIALDGFKQTLSCPAPAGCVADVALMAQAPPMMTASGYGDLLGKVPAGADWILSDVLGTEAIDQDVWNLVQGPLRGALARPAELAAGDLSAMSELAEGLIMSGLAMQAHQSSRPASGAEHQFSHLWEMEGHGVDVAPRRLSHGFKVGIGSVAIAALYESLLERDLANLDIDAAVAAWPSREQLEAEVRRLHRDPRLVEETVVQTLAKWVTPEELRSRLESLAAQWPALVPRLRAQLMPAAEMQQLLRSVGAPAHPSEIGLGWQRFRDTYRRAQMIRKRYTVLDIALETNLLSELVEELFAPQGFWGVQSPAVKEES